MRRARCRQGFIFCKTPVNREVTNYPNPSINKLTEMLFDTVSNYLEERALLLRGGTIMDATLIAASPSTKNAAKKRDPDISQTKRGNQWYFGIKAQQKTWGRSGQGRAHLSYREMPVRISQSTLSWADQKCGTDVQPHDIGQPLPRTTKTTGGVCLNLENAPLNAAKRRQIPSKTNKPSE